MNDILSVKEPMHGPMTYVQLAAWSGYSIRYLRMQVLSGKLKKRFNHKSTRFMPSDVQEWMDKGLDTREASK